MALFKGLYRGRGVYWHGALGWGDESKASFRTRAEMHAAIDAEDIRQVVLRAPQVKYWNSLTAEERAAWRTKFVGDVFDRFDSVADFAYAEFQKNKGGV